MTEPRHQIDAYTILIPTSATLNKYGLSVDAWAEILIRQDGACGACHKIPKSNRLVIDHEHVRGWKDMPTDQRSPFVRGLLCYMCNHYRLARGATVANLRGAANYLDDYAIRKTPMGKNWIRPSREIQNDPTDR